MNTHAPAIVRRSDLGLTIEGTRITLYAIVDYLRDGWPAPDIQEALRLTDEQMQSALAYITEHAVEVDTEYQQVLHEAEKNRNYWETRNHKSHVEQRPKSGQETARAKLAEQRARCSQEPAQVEREEQTRPMHP